MGSAEMEVLGNADIISLNLRMAIVVFFVLDMYCKSKMTGWWFVYVCSALLGLILYQETWLLCIKMLL